MVVFDFIDSVKLAAEVDLKREITTASGKQSKFVLQSTLFVVKQKKSD